MHRCCFEAMLKTCFASLSLYSFLQIDCVCLSASLLVQTWELLQVKQRHLVLVVNIAVGDHL